MSDYRPSDNQQETQEMLRRQFEAAQRIADADDRWDAKCRVWDAYFQEIHL